jgi:hypothetical protein
VAEVEVDGAARPPTPLADVADGEVAVQEEPRERVQDQAAELGTGVGVDMLDLRGENGMLRPDLIDSPQPRELEPGVIEDRQRPPARTLAQPVAKR